MLHSKYRPTTYQDFAGNGKAVREARGSLALWLAGRADGTGVDGLAIHIGGISGAGKTTLAHLLARESGATEMDILELDGAKCDQRTVYGLEQSGGLLSARPWGKSKVIVVNESHGMTAGAVQAWLTVLERLPKWALIIFTTTESLDCFGNFQSPFQRRVVQVTFTNQGIAAPFADRLVKVAAAEGYDLPHKTALRMVQDAKNNLGRAIEEVGKLLAERLMAA